MDEPLASTVERWAWDYITAKTLDEKLSPPPVPSSWETSPKNRRLEVPGRPLELRVIPKANKKRGVGSPEGRARVLHTFLHHELQAAELMLWAVLAFPHTPPEFRAGLVRIATDEVRHMGLYAAQIQRLGFSVGDFGVRDWFWERVPACEGPAAFVAVMGLGLESANLDHSATFAARFRDAGDLEAARVQEVVGLEEIAHVRFGARWFSALQGELDFDTWRRALPPPLSPWLMRGRPLARDARLRAGFPPKFIDELDAWQPDAPGY
jgi:uncharacterized ferritin-like protein (DUF455 family)